MTGRRYSFSSFWKLTLGVFIVVLVGLVVYAIAADSQSPVRVFVTDSQSWEVMGSSGGSRGNWGSSFGGGARPQTAEIIKTFNQRCPDLVVTRKAETADYAVILDHEGGKKFYRHDNKVAVVNKKGDVIFSHSTRSLGNAVEDACKAIHGTSSQSLPQPIDYWSPTNKEKASSPTGEVQSAGGLKQSQSSTSKEIKMGMTPIEVESALGQPETKVELGPKLLYRYKDLTVEFHDGKVVDVR